MLFQVFQIEPVIALRVDLDLEGFGALPYRELPDLPSASPRDLRDQTGDPLRGRIGG